jgi:hypothetical protein
MTANVYVLIAAKLLAVNAVSATVEQPAVDKNNRIY